MYVVIAVWPDSAVDVIGIYESMDSGLNAVRTFIDGYDYTTDHNSEVSNYKEVGRWIRKDRVIITLHEDNVTR